MPIEKPVALWIFGDDLVGRDRQPRERDDGLLVDQNVFVREIAAPDLEVDLKHNHSRLGRDLV